MSLNFGCQHTKKACRWPFLVQVAHVPDCGMLRLEVRLAQGKLVILQLESPICMRTWLLAFGFGFTWLGFDRSLHLALRFCWVLVS